MKQILLIVCLISATQSFAQDTLRLRNQYDVAPSDIKVFAGGSELMPDAEGNLVLSAAAPDTLLVYGADYDTAYVLRSAAFPDGTPPVKKNFSWTDLLTPMFYIVFGGIWFILFIIFAETGLFVGFFLPGDSLLFVTGIFSGELMSAGLGIKGLPDIIDILVLGIMISAAGIIGNMVGYWFGKKSGPFLFDRKETWFFRRRYLEQARDFYDKHGGAAIVIARFLPIIRTFAPIVAGIVDMPRKKFMYYNILGCFAWVFSMLLAGHYLQKLFETAFNFNLKEHLEVIVIGIVAVTTIPILIKLFFGKSKPKDPAAAL